MGSAASMPWRSASSHPAFGAQVTTRCVKERGISDDRSLRTVLRRAHVARESTARRDPRPEPDKAPEKEVGVATQLIPRRSYVALLSAYP